MNNNVNMSCVYKLAKRLLSMMLLKMYQNGKKNR